jgi:sulfite reductase (NADPH) hemoprotein beta-component
MSDTKSPFIVEGKLADNERLKAQSRHLRGTIEQDLKDPLTGGFTADNFQLIPFTACISRTTVTSALSVPSKN